jgi:hypothetical protein
MEAKELRLGNYVENDIGDVIFIDSHTLPFIVTKWIKCHHRIELTEEWLVKFGFEKIKNNGIDYELHDCVISFEAGWMWTAESKLNEVRTLIPKYVHQLQNLYFELTNEELTIK